MLLTIDAGNTNTVFAVFNGDALISQWRISSKAERTADEYAVWLTQLMQLQNIALTDIDAVICSCVVPYALYDLKQLSKRYFNTELLVVGEAPIGTPVKVDLEPNTEAGADRLVNGFAAWQRYKQACIIVDFGTATTFDIVNESGTYIGGVIAPGVHLSLNALQQAAAKLPNISIKAPSDIIGKNTISAMQSGIYFGYAGMIEGLITRLKTQLNKNTKVIATGGLAPLYAKEVGLFDEVDQELTINGLREIYNGYA